MIGCLARDFDVTVLSARTTGMTGARCEALPSAPRRSLGRRMAHLCRLSRGRFRHLVWPPGLRELAAQHRARNYDFIAVHDLRLLPAALAIRASGRVLFDAREYYPRQYEDVWWWRRLYRPMNRALCRRYLKRADHVITVSSGLAQEYRREFGIECQVLPSLPAPKKLEPSTVDPQRIRLIHHGLASRSRRLEGMIEMMEHLPARFSLDLMLVPSDRAYLSKLERLARSRRTRILSPVPFTQLVETTNAYDIGVFLVPPVNFNLQFALPNKFFEFVQARLMVAIGPSPDMASYVREHDLGLVADDFQPRTLARALAVLSADDIARFKQQAHRAAEVLNSTHTDAALRALALRHPNVSSTP